MGQCVIAGANLQEIIIRTNFFKQKIKIYFFCAVKCYYKFTDKPNNWQFFKRFLGIFFTILATFKTKPHVSKRVF